MFPARMVLAACMLLASSAFAGERVLEVITLNYRSAEEVLPLLAPLVSQYGGVITGTQNQIIVNASSESVAEVKRVLAAIDKAPRQLLITVKSDDARTRSRSEAEIAADAGSENARVTVQGTGGSGGVVVEGRSGDDSVRARALEQQSRTRERNLNTIQVLEGNAAFISSGQSVPVPERTIVNTPEGIQIIDSAQYRVVASGFYVLPRVSGDTVTLEISPQRETFNNHGGIERRQAMTRISARVGEWIEIAGVNDEQYRERSAIASRERAMRRSDSAVWIKVEELRY